MAGQFPDPAEGSRAEAKMYATAMLLARVRYSKERCANQVDPHRVVEMLPVREKQYGLVPGRNDTIPQRQTALAAKVRLPQGASYSAVSTALMAAIGDDFLYYRVTKPGEIQTFPFMPSTGPGNFVRASAPPVIVRLRDGVSKTGVLMFATYDPVIPGKFVSPGDTLVISANNIGLAELVAVTAADEGVFQTVFTKSHDRGDICTSSYFPYWKSTMSHVTVVVTPEAAVDPEKRRKIDLVMREIMRSITIWDIVPDDGTGTATAVYTIEDPVLGRVGYAGIGSSLAYP